MMGRPPIPPQPTADAIETFLAREQAVRNAKMQLVRARQELAHSVHERRIALELTLFQVSHLAGVNESELSKLERGKLARGIDLARKVDAVLTRIERERVALGRAS